MTTFLWLLAWGAIGIVDIGFLIADAFVWSLFAFTLFAVAAYFIMPTVAHWVQTVGWMHILTHYVPIYLGAGVATAVFKWLQYVHRASGPMEKKRIAFEKVFNEAEGLFESYKNHWNPSEKNEGTRVVPIDPRMGAGSVSVSSTGKSSEPKPSSVAVDAVAFKRALFLRYNQTSDYHNRQINTDAVRGDLEFAPKSINELTDDRVFLDKITPKAKDHKTEIAVWIYEWPFVWVATVIGDWLLNLAKHVAALFDSWLGGLSRAIMGRATKGL
jgi:hypothetical protein